MSPAPVPDDCAFVIRGSQGTAATGETVRVLQAALAAGRARRVVILAPRPQHANWLARTRLAGIDASVFAADQLAGAVLDGDTVLVLDDAPDDQPRFQAVPTVPLTQAARRCGYLVFLLTPPPPFSASGLPLLA